MKELLKVVSKKLFIYSFIVNLIYSIADYGQSFALSIFGTSPLTMDKLVKLGISIIIADILMLVFGKIGSYIDNVNEAKATNNIAKHYCISKKWRRWTPIFVILYYCTWKNIFKFELFG